MNIRKRKLAIAVILVLANIITITGIVRLDIYNNKSHDLFMLFKNISFGILVLISAAYILHLIVINVARVKLENDKNSYYNKGIKQKQDILYQWNRRKDTIIYSANIYKKYSIEMILKDFMKSIKNSKGILDENKDDLLGVMNKLINGSSYEQVEVKLKKIDGTFSWVRISGTAIVNRFGELTKIVGVVTDIDEEKRKKEELIFRAERDSLTKVYNRGKFIELVDDYLNGAGKDKKSYLVMLDVDDFKLINDNLGHIYGDKVLINLTDNIKSKLNQDEFIGRLGGDEFCVFIEGSYEDSYILKRADEIMNAIMNTYVCEDKKINITSSIGIAQYPQHGQSFRELYVKSDKALYKAKEKGKGRYIIYGEY